MGEEKRREKRRRDEEGGFLSNCLMEGRCIPKLQGCLWGCSFPDRYKGQPTFSSHVLPNSGIEVARTLF
jgi:hypothetical protein